MLYEMNFQLINRRTTVKNEKNLKLTKKPKLC